MGNLLTKTKIENAFGKEEYVIVGEFENTNGIDGENDDSIIENFEIKITGQDANGQYSHSEILKPCIDHPILTYQYQKDEELGALSKRDLEASTFPVSTSMYSITISQS